MSVPVVHPLFTNVDTSPVMAVGTVVRDPANGKRYKYVKFLDAVTYIAGQVVEYANTAGTSVTNDRAGGSAIGTQTAPAGLCLAVQTQNSYGFIQISGVGLAIGDGSVAAGEAVVSHSVDGQADTMAAGEEHQVFGIALDDDGTGNDPLATSNMFHVYLRGLC